LAVTKEAYDGKFSSKEYVGTLSNKGVSYAITPAWSKKIPAALQTEVRDLAAAIAGGFIDVNNA
jgi:basic membrane protein A and related proteins